MITPVEHSSRPPAAQRWHTLSSMWWRALPLGLVVAFLFLYATVLPPLITDWLDDPNYSHGFLVPGVSAYFVWERRQILVRLRPQPHWGGLVLLGCGLGMLLLGHLGAELFLMRSSMVVVLTALVWYLLGLPYVHALALPLAFLLFMIPLPAILLNTITLPLQRLATQVSTFALQLVQLPVYREGNIIYLPHTTLEVAEACSGLSSLVSLLALAVVLAYITQHRLSTRWILVLSAIPIALVANAFRIWATGVLAQRYGPHVAEGFYHTFAGWLVFVVALALLLSEGALLSLLRRAWERIGGEGDAGPA
jgi:exosortase